MTAPRATVPLEPPSMIINMTTFAGRKEHYIGQTLESLFASDGCRLPLNLILGSSDASHVRAYRDVANVVEWGAVDEWQTAGGGLRHRCNVNAIRALKYGDSDYCLCCEDDIAFDRHWLAQLRLTIEEIEGTNYVLNLGQQCDQSPTRRYAAHTLPSLCGAQGIFYPTRPLRSAVADYVRRNCDKGTNDDLIGRYAKQYAALYNATPGLVRHIGQVSCFHQPGPSAR